MPKSASGSTPMPSRYMRPRWNCASATPASHQLHVSYMSVTSRPHPHHALTPLHPPAGDTISCHEPRTARLELAHGDGGLNPKP